jgi:hypothetical protein
MASNFSGTKVINREEKHQNNKAVKRGVNDALKLAMRL